jgi:hypothetical protein
MKEAICWIGFNRPEYSRVSLESIFNANDRPKDFYAYVDNDSTERSESVVNILKIFGVTNIVFREKNYNFSNHILLAYKDFFSKGYDICHYIEDDIIVSKTFFIKSREILAKNDIIMFCGCLAGEDQRNKIYPHFSTWGSSFKKELYILVEPHIENFIKAWDNGTTIEYQLKNFGVGLIDGFDGLMDNIVKKNKLLCVYPEYSYSKDIGEYGYHRKSGIPPVKTLNEWANEPPKGVFGYGINGIDFKLD